MMFLKRCFGLFVAFGLLLPFQLNAEQAFQSSYPHKFPVHERFGSIFVDTSAPYPPEITNEVQARVLAQDAATVLGQNEILRVILEKRTRSGVTLETARIPSTQIQEDIQKLIKDARVSHVRFDKNGCRLRVSIRKKDLKAILKKS